MPLCASLFVILLACPVLGVSELVAQMRMAACQRNTRHALCVRGHTTSESRSGSSGYLAIGSLVILCVLQLIRLTRAARMQYQERFRVSKEQERVEQARFVLNKISRNVRNASTREAVTFWHDQLKEAEEEFPLDEESLQPLVTQLSEAIRLRQTEKEKDVERILDAFRENGLSEHMIDHVKTLQNNTYAVQQLDTQQSTQLTTVHRNDDTADDDTTSTDEDEIDRIHPRGANLTVTVSREAELAREQNENHHRSHVMLMLCRIYNKERHEGNQQRRHLETLNARGMLFRQKKSAHDARQTRWQVEQERLWAAEVQRRLVLLCWVTGGLYIVLLMGMQVRAVLSWMDGEWMQPCRLCPQIHTGWLRWAGAAVLLIGVAPRMPSLGSGVGFLGPLVGAITLCYYSPAYRALVAGGVVSALLVPGLLHGVLGYSLNLQSRQGYWVALWIVTLTAAPLCFLAAAEL